MAGRKRRLSKSEVEQLNRMVGGRTVRTSRGAYGNIVRFTRGSVQICLTSAEDVKTYPLFDSFITGALVLTDPVLQGRVVGVLSSRTPKQGNPNAAPVVRNNGVTSSVQHLATTTRNRGAHDGKDLPVAENAKVFCVLKGTSHNAFLGHMRKLGLDDFTALTPTRSRAGLPYLSLKEAAGYMGCGADALLST